MEKTEKIEVQERGWVEELALGREHERRTKEESRASFRGERKQKRRRPVHAITRDGIGTMGKRSSGVLAEALAGGDSPGRRPTLRPLCSQSKTGTETRLLVASSTCSFALRLSSAIFPRSGRTLHDALDDWTASRALSTMREDASLQACAPSLCYCELTDIWEASPCACYFLRLRQ